MKKIERRKEITQIFNDKNGGEITKFYLRSDVYFLTGVFEKVSIRELSV